MPPHEPFPCGGAPPWLCSPEPIAIWKTTPEREPDPEPLWYGILSALLGWLFVVLCICLGPLGAIILLF